MVNEEDPIQFVPLSESVRGFINQPGSFWVFKRDDGRIDTARLSSIDSSKVWFNYNSPTDYIDAQICELRYYFPFAFHQKFVLKSSMISETYSVGGIPWGNLRYVAPTTNVQIGDTICGWDNCLALVEQHDTIQVAGSNYYNVTKCWTNEGFILFWDPLVGLIQYEENGQVWKLIDYEL